MGPFAMWKFREFNELPHIFEERMNRSLEPANKYVSLFHNPLMAIIARCQAYISGAIVAVLLLTSIFEQGAFLFVKIADHNLLWHLGLFSAMFAGARSLIPDETTTKKSAQELVEQFSSHTHYFPEQWKGKEDKIKTKDEVVDLFPVKTTLFSLELLSVILTPIVLCFSLPNSVPKVLEFISKHAVYVEGVGDVCDYSLFKFEDYGDQDFGTEVEGKEGTKHKLKDGKLEKSILNFHLAHPHWNATEAGKSFVARLKNYKDVTTRNTNDMMASLLEKSIMNGSHYLAPTHGGPVDGVTAGMTSPADMDNANATANTDKKSNDQQREQPPQENTRPSVVSNSVSASSPLKDIFLSPPRDLLDKSTGGQSASAAFASFSASPNQPVATDSMLADLPSVLMSIMKQENIDYHNDFYWLTKFQQQRKADPVLFENSLQLSSMMGSHSLFSSSLNIAGLQHGPDRSILVSPKASGMYHSRSFTTQSMLQRQQQRQQQQPSPTRKGKEGTTMNDNSNNGESKNNSSGENHDVAEL